jgi:hypothetical protein
MGHRPPTASIRSRPRRPDIQFGSVPRVARRAAPTSSRKWRTTCGRRPRSTTMFSTSMRCCIRARSSIIQRTSWRILRCRCPRNARFWHPGHRMRRRSLRVPRCGRLSASKRPSPSMRSWRLSANSMAVPAIRRAVSRSVCVQGFGSLVGRTPWTKSNCRTTSWTGSNADGRPGSHSYWKASRGSGGQPVERPSPIAASSASSGRVVLTAAEVGRNARPLPGLTGPGSSRKQGPGGGCTAASSRPVPLGKANGAAQNFNPKPPLPALSGATKQRAAVVAVTCRSS